MSWYIQKKDHSSQQLHATVERFRFYLFLSAEELEEILGGVPFGSMFAKFCSLWLAMHFGELDAAKLWAKEVRNINVVTLGI